MKETSENLWSNQFTDHSEPPDVYWWQVTLAHRTAVGLRTAPFVTNAPLHVPAVMWYDSAAVCQCDGGKQRQHTHESLHSRRLVLESCSSMSVDDVGLNIYRKNMFHVGSGTQPSRASGCHLLHMNQQWIRRRRRGEGGRCLRDLIVKKNKTHTDRTIMQLGSLHQTVHRLHLN